MTGPWEPSDYRDSYTDRINNLIEALRASVVAAKTKKTPSGKATRRLARKQTA